MNARKSIKRIPKIEISARTLSAWLWISVGNMCVWCYVLSVVLRHTNVKQDLQTPGDVFAFGVTLAMAVLSVATSLSLLAARSHSYKMENPFA